MKNALKGNFSKFVLIGKIKGLANESKKARVRILKAKKETAVSNLAFRKYVVGIDIRHHLLAYAFLQGRPYRSLEKKCAKDNMPSPDLVWKVIETHAPKWTVHVGSYNPTLADVHAWLAAPEVL